MNFLLAPNAMKGALSAQKISLLLAKTLRRNFPDGEIISSPIADGGNGTLDCLIDSLGGTIYEQVVTGPIPSMKVNARFGVTKNNVAIIESAEAIGHHLLSPSPDSIAQSTSYGVGELILAAFGKNCSEIWIGLGGTATNDGGAGMAQALGWKLLDANGDECKAGAIHLLNVTHIVNEFSIHNRPLTILSDVNNLLLGTHGATYTFAQQKGATEDQLPYLEAALKNFSEIVQRDLKKDRSEVAGSGAAGGLGFGLVTFCNGKIVSGIEFILDKTDFNEKLRICDCVITTEGMLDDQTLFGKGIAGIADRARQFNKPVHAFVGRIKGNSKELQTTLGLASLTQISPDELSTQEAIRDASWLLADTVYNHSF